jgi:hypothetical protein
MKIKFYPFSEKTISFAPPPIPALKMLPGWYRAQPSEVEEETNLLRGNFAATVKKCMPIFDSMTAGYLILAPCDIYLDSTNSEKLEYSVPVSLKMFQSDMFASHDRKQYTNYPIDYSDSHKDLFRIMPFWSIQTEKGYSTLIMNPMHGESSPLTAIPGIVDTDSFISEGHFSFIVKSNFKGIIKQGTPLVQIIPFKRDSWEMEIVSEEESERILSKQRLSLRSTFVNGYKNKMRAKKEYK